MNGCRMDDPHNEGSASNIFSELIRRQGAVEHSGDSASEESELPSPQPTAPAAPIGAISTPAALTTPTRDLPDSAEGGGREPPPPPSPPPTNPAAGAGFFGGMLRALLILPLVALLAAAIATFAISWQQRRPHGQELAALSTEAPKPTIAVTPRHLRRIGIVAGHRGVYNDPGAVCEDGLTEREVNEVVAEKVVLHLRGLGYHAELLDEFDSRLKDYQAAALISLHANDCKDYGEHVTGYLIARAAARATGGADDLLVQCLGENYAQATGLRVRAGITSDMSEYHSFVEIHPYTPAAILEMGFLLADRRVLTEQTDRVARGVYDGVLCFLAATGST